jgi:hypothetical protein
MGLYTRWLRDWRGVGVPDVAPSKTTYCIYHDGVFWLITDAWTRFEALTRNVSELHFYNSRIPSDLLMDLARIPKALKKLTYHHGTPSGSDADICYKDIADRLHDLRSIQQLTLLDNSDIILDEDEVGCLGDALRPLLALRSLYTDLTAFRTDELNLGELLPPGIADLTLRYFTEPDALDWNTEVVIPYLQSTTALKSLCVRSILTKYVETHLSAFCGTRGILFQTTSRD